MFGFYDMSPRSNRKPTLGQWSAVNLKNLTSMSCKLTTVFVDTRLWKTKHSRKRFQNFHQSLVLLTCRIEIHQSQPASMT